MGASQSVPKNASQVPDAAAVAQQHAATAGVAAAGGKCPVDHSAGAAGAVSPAMAEAARAGGCPIDHSKTGSQAGGAAAAGKHADAGKCPVDHTAKAASAAPAAAGGECPMGYDTPDPNRPASNTGKVYNVYGQEINPRNMMPSLAQKPAPGQKAPLSTHRVQSNIPKGGTESETWLYPSPQQFYNALVRKDKADNVSEADMEHVVAIHNAMNERGWSMLREWETRFHGSELQPGCPKLRRFMGRPFEPSPKARIKAMLGFGEPFDRHDWFVDRGDGKEVRYVLDYYFDSKVEAADPDPKSTKCIHVDVRPAVDSPGAFVDRIMAFPGRALDALKNFKTFADGTDPEAVPEKFTAALGGGGSSRKGAQPSSAVEFKTETARAAADRLATMDRKCNPLRVKLAEAKTEDEARTAFVGLTYCLGTAACPAEASAFMRAVESATPAQDELEAGLFETMRECVVGKMAADVAATKAEGARA